METEIGYNHEKLSVVKPLQGDVPFTDVGGKPIFVGNIIEQTNYNGELYVARYKVVRDPADNEVCLCLVSGNKKAMSYASAYQNIAKNNRPCINKYVR